VLIYFFAGIQMSAARLNKKRIGVVCQEGCGEICEVGSETSRLVGARERRGGLGEASQAHLSARRGSVRVDRQDNRPRKDVAAK